MSQIRVGVIGLSSQGWASTVLAPPLTMPPLSSSYRITAVCTRSEDSAALSATEYAKRTDSTVKGYSGPDGARAVAADEDVDMLAVAVKPPDHFAAAMPALEAGKHLFVEWPAGKSLAETEALAEAARKSGVRTIVGCQGRQSPTLKMLKGMIESGKLGRIMSTTVTGRPYRELFAWAPYVREGVTYATDASNGATFLDIAVGHFLDSFTFVLGPFASLSAVCENQYPAAELVDGVGQPTGRTIGSTSPSQVAVVGELASGAVASLHWRGGLESREGKAGTPFLWQIDGAKGSVRLESDSAGGSFIQVKEPSMYVDGVEVKVESDDGLTNIGRAWAEFANGQQGEYATLEDAVRTRRMLDAISRSAREGRRIDLSVT
ncbi:NAD-binding Rossmann fold oxidoreductase [Obba rivulosa]|uniref:NAD-binding Rossmann fold oxidoreductase n=1 Tax=Obba rivulosa TaxID=1052685 RepID=A0A8E2DKX9_9APHY|nr:NAD-binding Rossmann fold oxidoreductase [Obba rivulosa]